MDKKNAPLRIALTGPESTGKTSLARSLARRLDTLWAPEFARYYLRTLDRSYNQADFTTMLNGQLFWEDQMARVARRWLFCDTDPLVYKIWSLEKYGTCPPDVLQAVERRNYAFYLLCDIDLPWQYDPLREHPSEKDRRRLWQLYYDELMKTGTPFAVVSGLSHEARFEAAMQILGNIKAP